MTPSGSPEIASGTMFRGEFAYIVCHIDRLRPPPKPLKDAQPADGYFFLKHNPRFLAFRVFAAHHYR
jgi:hypothetical protein